MKLALNVTGSALIVTGSVLTKVSSILYWLGNVLQGKHKNYYSLGDICDSKYWISFQGRPWDWRRWGLSFGPTYNGTITGLVFMVPFVVVIGHVRKLP